MINSRCFIAHKASNKKKLKKNYENKTKTDNYTKTKDNKNNTYRLYMQLLTCCSCCIVCLIRKCRKARFYISSLNYRFSLTAVDRRQKVDITSTFVSARIGIVNAY